VTLGLLVGAAVALLGAEILGEYEFKGFTGAVSGLLFGLLVTEVVVAVSKERGNVLAAATTVLVVAGLSWAIWKSTGQGHDRSDPVPGGAWLGLALAAGAAVIRARKPGSTARRNRSQP
jgi:hypothetical protein